MIRLPRYPDKVKWEYLYFVAAALPFPKEVILPKSEDGGMIEWERIFETKPPFPEPIKKRLTRTNRNYLKACEMCAQAAGEIEDGELVKLFLRRYVRKLYEFLYKEGALQEDNLKKLLLEPMGTLPEIDCRVEGLLAEDVGGDAKDCIEILSYFFSYERLSGNKNFDRLVEEMGVDVCPYCNRVLIRPTKNQRQGQIDHFRSKSGYPQFAVSLLNLVPSCSVCNHKKGDTDDKAIFYPYLEELHEEDRFQTEPISGLQYLLGEDGSGEEFRICLKRADSVHPEQYDEKIDNIFHDVFDLEELYQQHRGYVLLMFRQNALWGKDYLDSLGIEWRERFMSQEELDSVRYLKQIEPESYICTPLGRLTHDIDEEIRRLERDAQREKNAQAR